LYKTNFVFPIFKTNLFIIDIYINAFSVFAKLYCRKRAIN
jgi:hypothetical protein